MNSNHFKIALVFLLFSLSSSNVFSQETIWFDASFHKTSKEKATYYRPIPKQKRSNFLIIDYYKNGNKFREGKGKTPDLNNELFQGYVTYYFSDETLFKKVNFKKGVMAGAYMEYYRTGELKESGRYEDGKRDGGWKFYNKSGKIKTKGTYKDGEKVGVWKTFYKNIY